MVDLKFTHGLHDLGNGCWAWLQPDGGWGWSNAGLIEDSGESLLIDTLFDLPLTADMLSAMRNSVPAAREIGTLVNTHANGDHTYGNQLVRGARILASRQCREEMERRPPEAFIKIARNWQDYGEAGALIYELMGRKFDFDGIVNTLPTETFETEFSLSVGDTQIELVNVGPAHTKGDVLVHVPARRTVFTGDIVFAGGHPIIWEGPVENWISACDLILGWDVETIVPGHGPISDKTAVRELRSYLTILAEATRSRFEAGMSWTEAAEEIVADHFRHWLDRERIFINVASLYRQLSDGAHKLKIAEIYGPMAQWYWTHRKSDANICC
jgi:glyoxylase-like metal-dependent hydrolase (beta-lactamase superfamily II)